MLKFTNFFLLHKNDFFIRPPPAQSDKSTYFRCLWTEREKKKKEEAHFRRLILFWNSFLLYFKAKISSILSAEACAGQKRREACLKVVNPSKKNTNSNFFNDFQLKNWTSSHNQKNDANFCKKIVFLIKK